MAQSKQHPINQLVDAEIGRRQLKGGKEINLC